MKQSRLMSFVETTLSTAIGFAVALATQLIVFPLFGWNPSITQNLLITVIFTVVSIARGFLLRRLFEALHIRAPLSPSLLAIAAERRRQIESEGWTIEHDDLEHNPGELAQAAACYAACAFTKPSGTPIFWPWEGWWKWSDDPRRNLVRSAALIVAELEKFERSRKLRRKVVAPPSPITQAVYPEFAEGGEARGA
jgi:hypothetical protein